jgi:hypothetical protein
MKKYKFLGIFAFLIMALFGCQDQSEQIEEIEVGREFSPIELEVESSNHNSATIKWKAIKGSTQRFAVQVFQDDSLSFSGQMIGETVVEYAFRVQLTNLLPEIRYSIRLQTIGETDSETSKWHGLTFKTSSEQIMTGIKNIKASKALVKWQPGETVTHLLLASEGQSDLTINLDATDLAAGEKLITNLASDKSHEVSIYNGIGRRGRLSFKTMYRPANATELPLGADLAAYLADGATLLLPDGYTWTGPTNAAVTLPSTIAIYGDPDADVQPKLIGAAPGGGKCFFNLPVTGDNILIANVEITALDGLGGFSLIDQQGGDNICEVKQLTFDNCYIHEIERSVVRTRDGGVRSIDKLAFNNCIIERIGFSGSNNQTFYFQAPGRVLSLELTNSTFNDCGFKTQFIDTRFADATSVTVESCTFYNLIAGSNNTSVRYFLTATGACSLTMNNSILGKTYDEDTPGYQGAVSKTTTGVIGGTNNYKTADWKAIANPGTVTGAFDLPGLVETGGDAAALFEDPASNNFQLKATVANAIKNTGDPRWR